MQRFATHAVTAAFVALAASVTPAVAAPLAEPNASAEASVDVSAQRRSQPSRRRARTQILVYPRYPYRNFHTVYPLPYPVEYPGPNAVRLCTSNLVQEYRPSGTVVVPRMRCRWARG